MAYTNSNLATYRKVTRHCNPGRRDPIDRITIHCVVGQCTAQGGVDYFYSTNRQASSNYVVGLDGSVGISVDEADIAWTSSSFENDKRAITIEVASDVTPPYAVTDAAYERLIELCADICKRNGRKRALWITAPKQTNNIWQQGQLDMAAAFAHDLKDDEMLFTVHRWFSASKSCPGDYLHGRMGDIVNRVNQLLGSPSKPSTDKPKDPTPSTVSGVVSKREDTIYNYLVTKELPLAAICGIMSNMYQESGYISNNLQNSYERMLGKTDEAYTRAVDDGTYDNFIYDKAGYGLVQWTFWTLKKELLDYAKKHNKSIGDYKVQCDLLYEQFKRDAKLWQILQHAPATAEAAYTCGYRICYDFERPANKEVNSKQRGQYAKQLFNKYAPEHKDDPVITKPDKEDSLYGKLKVGETYQFVGSYQYQTVNSSKPVAADYNGYIKILQKQPEQHKHPILARSVDDQGKFIPSIYGWIDVTDIEEPFKPYRVKVTDSSLNIRSGPSTSYRINGVITDKGVYTIVEEKNGWGKLKSGAGWISLYYTREA